MRARPSRLYSLRQRVVRVLARRIGEPIYQAYLWVGELFGRGEPQPPARTDAAPRSGADELLLAQYRAAVARGEHGVKVPPAIAPAAAAAPAEEPLADCAPEGATPHAAAPRILPEFEMIDETDPRRRRVIHRWPSACSRPVLASTPTHAIASLVGGRTAYEPDGPHQAA